MLDIAGAFDTVWHKRLIQKCKSLGIHGAVLAFLNDYLRDRSQCVTIDGELSTCLPVTAGVPQGSILGPILFLIYINDLPAAVESISLLFADDCTLLQLIPNPSNRHEAADVLQRDLNAVTDWTRLNQLNFAPHKTQLMLVSRRERS